MPPQEPPKAAATGGRLGGLAKPLGPSFCPAAFYMESGGGGHMSEGGRAGVWLSKKSAATKEGKRTAGSVCVCGVGGKSATSSEMFSGAGNGCGGARHGDWLGPNERPAFAKRGYQPPTSKWPLFSSYMVRSPSGRT